MRTTYVLLMSICLLHGQLLSMKPKIEKAEDLLQLALECAPDAYAEKIKKYTISAQVLNDSVALLLGSTDGDDYGCQSDDYKLALEIMSEFYWQKRGYLFSSDVIKKDIYTYLKREISQKEQEIDVLKDNNRCSRLLARDRWGHCDAYEGLIAGAIALAVLDMILFVFCLKI